MPISLPTALLVGGGLSAAGGVASGILGSNAASNAADAQAGAANNAAQLQRQNAIDSLDFQKQVFNQQQRNSAPGISAGSGALSKLSALMGIPGISQLSQDSIAQGVGGGTTGSTPAIPGGLLNFLRNGGDLSTLGQRPNNPGGFQLMQANGAQVPASGGGSAIVPNGPTAANGGGSATVPLGGPMVSGNPGGPQASGTPGGVIQANGGGSAQVPFDTSGAASGGGFGSLLQPYGQTFQAPTDVTQQNDPGFKFRLQQGMDALQNSAAAKGGLLSGGTAKALNDYAQNSASNEYGNVYNRAMQTHQTNYNQYNNDQNNLYNRLANLAGMGQTSVGQLNSSGSQAASNVGNILLGSGQTIGNDLQNAGAARGSGYVGSANAIGGGISSGLNSLGGSLSLLALLNKSGGGASNAGWGVI